MAFTASGGSSQPWDAFIPNGFQQIANSLVVGGTHVEVKTPEGVRQKYWK
jgi:hypothetical protein